MTEPPSRIQRGGDHLPADWNAPYAATPPWDIGRPQRPFLDLVGSGWLQGSVLDVGCGTGDLVFLMAELGLEATGIDIAGAAITKARAKAQRRAGRARFLQHDALRLDSLDETFDVVLDCGFFHVLSDHERVEFAAMLRGVLRPGGRYFMLCFSDRVPGDSGPRRVSEEEVRSTFEDGFAIEEIREAYFEATFLTDLIPAWFVRIARLHESV